MSSIRPPGERVISRQFFDEFVDAHGPVLCQMPEAIVFILKRSKICGNGEISRR